MSEHTKDLRVTLKAGSGYDAPWVTVDADHPDELDEKLIALLNGDTMKLVVDVAQHFRAVHNALPVTHPDQGGAGAPAPTANPAPKRGGWGQPAASPTGAPPAPAPQASVVYHPAGITCDACGTRVQYKSIFSKAKNKTFNLWSCPNQRSKGDGHYSDFAD